MPLQDAGRLAAAAARTKELEQEVRDQRDKVDRLRRLEMSDGPAAERLADLERNLAAATSLLQFLRRGQAE